MQKRLFYDPREIRLVDLCAGLGGFHRALELVAHRLQRGDDGPPTFKVTCVAAAELDPALRRAYVSNFEGIAVAYGRHHPPHLVTEVESLVGDELAPELPQYTDDGRLESVHGDLAVFLTDDRRALRTGPDGTPLLPPHDLLCAGFPCQPFSKSGHQRGFEDTRGTVFHMIATIIQYRRPSFVVLENVGNFARHDEGNTWKRVRQVLEEFGYSVAATEPRSVGENAPGLLSPHHLGYAHHRERFFIVAQLQVPAEHASPLAAKLCVHEFKAESLFRKRPAGASGNAHRAKLEAQSEARLHNVLSRGQRMATKEDLLAAAVSPARRACVKHWSELVQRLEHADRAVVSNGWADRHQLFRDSMPSFPIWGYELDPWNWYPLDRNPSSYSDLDGLSSFREKSLTKAAAEVLEATTMESLLDYPPEGQRSWLQGPLTGGAVQRWIDSWPGYAGRRKRWPRWKVRFIEQNRSFSLRLWARLDPQWLREWLDGLFHYETPDGIAVRAASHQKLEWNCKGCDLDIWSHILQFRPSGLRVKRMSHVPALVAMTTTQVPVVSDRVTRPNVRSKYPGLRHILVVEGLQLQGFPSDWRVPDSREQAFKALGNAVHARLVADIFAAWWFGLDGGPDTHPTDEAEAHERKVRREHTCAQVELPFSREVRPEPTRDR